MPPDRRRRNLGEGSRHGCVRLQELYDRPVCGACATFVPAGVSVGAADESRGHQHRSGADRPAGDARRRGDFRRADAAGPAGGVARSQRGNHRSAGGADRQVRLHQDGKPVHRLGRRRAAGQGLWRIRRGRIARPGLHQLRGHQQPDRRRGLLCGEQRRADRLHGAAAGCAGRLHDLAGAVGRRRAGHRLQPGRRPDQPDGAGGRYARGRVLRRRGLRRARSAGGGHRRQRPEHRLRKRRRPPPDRRGEKLRRGG